MGEMRESRVKVNGVKSAESRQARARTNGIFYGESVIQRREPAGPLYTISPDRRVRLCARRQNKHAPLECGASPLVPSRTRPRTRPRNNRERGPQKIKRPSCELPQRRLSKAPIHSQSACAARSRLAHYFLMLLLIDHALSQRRNNLMIAAAAGLLCARRVLTKTRFHEKATSRAWPCTCA